MTRTLTQCSKDLLAVVTYRSRNGGAKTTYMIEKEIKERFGRTYKIADYNKALEQLSKENAGNGDDFLIECNGWFSKMTMQIIPVTKDDLDWYYGTGRFAQ